MDRFLDEQESPATLDRVGLSAISAADCDQVTGQQQVSGFTADDSTSCSQVCADDEPVVLHEGGRITKSRASNGGSLMAATGDRVETLSTAELSVGEVAAAGTADDASVKLDAVRDTDLQRADAAAATLHSPDSRVDIAGKLPETDNSDSTLPAFCAAADDEMSLNGRSEEMATQKVDAVDGDVTATVTVSIEDRPSTDVDGVASSGSTTTATVCDQRVSGDDKTVSNSGNHPTSTSIGLDAELSMRECPVDVGCAPAGDVDQVKPDDVEQLLAAVDSATSVAGSLYSNVDPLTAALEFSSSTGVSIDLLSNKMDTDATCRQASGFTDSGVPSNGAAETDVQPSESALSSNSSLLAVRSDGVPTATSCLPPNCTDASKHDDGTVAVESDSAAVSTTPDVENDAEGDVEMSMDEAPVTVIPSSASNSLAADQGLLLSEKADDDNRPNVVRDEVAVTSIDDDENRAAVQSPPENEFTSLNSNQFTESHFPSNDIADSASGPDAGSMDVDDADANTDTDGVAVSSMSRDVELSDRLADQSRPLDEAGQSEDMDSSSLLLVASDADTVSTAS